MTANRSHADAPIHGYEPNASTLLVLEQTQWIRPQVATKLYLSTFMSVCIWAVIARPRGSVLLGMLIVAFAAVPIAAISFLVFALGRPVAAIAVEQDALILVRRRIGRASLVTRIALCDLVEVVQGRIYGSSHRLTFRTRSGERYRISLAPLHGDPHGLVALEARVNRTARAFPQNPFDGSETAAALCLVLQDLGVVTTQEPLPTYRRVRLGATKQWSSSARAQDDER